MRTPSILVGAAALVACGYRLHTADVVTLQNMAPNCALNVAILADAGSGPNGIYMQVRSTDRACVCGARGILARAGQPLADAGRAGCPQ